MRLRTALRCSVVLALLAPAPASAIVGGTDAPSGSTYDAVANVSIAGLFGCTGTLVTPDVVLSAGHCGSVTGGSGLVATPLGWPAGTITATVGTTKADGTGGETRTVTKVTIPPDYLGTGSGYDISLLTLGAKATKAPVPIAGKGLEALWAPGTLETIAGFGVTEEDGDAPATMQVAKVPVIADADCAKAYPGSYEAKSQLCAGYPQGGTDTCQGDSGGPLFGTDGTGALRVVGATSYGDGCAQPGKPGVYARVADTTLREWIRGQAPAAIADAGGAGAPAATTGGGGGAASGGGTSPGGTQQAATTVSPRALGLVVRALRAQRSRLGRGVAVRIASGAPGSVALRLRSTAAHGRRAATVGRRTVRLRTAGTRTVRVALSRAAAKALARRGALRLDAVFTAGDGHRAVQRLRVPLR